MKGIKDSRRNFSDFIQAIIAVHVFKVVVKDASVKSSFDLSVEMNSAYISWNKQINLIRYLHLKIILFVFMALF